MELRIEIRVNTNKRSSIQDQIEVDIYDNIRNVLVGHSGLTLESDVRLDDEEVQEFALSLAYDIKGKLQ